MTDSTAKAWASVVILLFNVSADVNVPVVWRTWKVIPSSNFAPSAIFDEHRNQMERI